MAFPTSPAAGPQLLRGLYPPKAGEYVRSFFGGFGLVTVAELAWLLECFSYLLIPADLQAFIGLMLWETEYEQVKQAKKPRLSTRIVLPCARPQRGRRPLHGRWPQRLRPTS